MLLTVDLGQLGVSPGDRLLDVGCGEGRHCFGALERGARVVGLDLDTEALRKGHGPLRARARELGGSGVMLRGDAFRLPFADATFDRAICSEVMEHVHDYRAAARELARVVRPGGSAAVTVPTATSEHLYLRLGDDYFESPGGHIRIFRPRDLAAALADAGLRPTGVGFAHGFHTYYWALRSAVGLPVSDANRLVQLYRLFLIKATTSPLLAWLEDAILNRICPKSLVLYAKREVSLANRVANQQYSHASEGTAGAGARSEPKASEAHRARGGASNQSGSAASTAAEPERSGTRNATRHEPRTPA